MDRDFYSFARLCDVRLPLTVRMYVHCMHIILDSISLRSSLQGRALPSRDLFITATVYADNKPLTATYQTAYKPFRKVTTSNEKDVSQALSREFGELLVFPMRLADLPLNAQLVFTVWDTLSIDDLEDGKTQTDGMPFANILGGTTMRLFGKKGTLKKASHRLYLWHGVRGDGSVETSTPSKIANDPNRKKDEMARLEKLIKLHERADLPHLLWLDKLSYRQIEKIHLEESLHSDDIYLYIDLPRFAMPIVFCEQEASIPPPFPVNVGQQPAQSSNPHAEAGSASSVSRGIDASLFTIYDGDMLMERENPVEAKHRRLVRSHRSGPLDRELKPNANVRDELNEILSYPPTRALTSAESDLIWSFRFYLTRFPSGLTKFLKSVSWYDHSEAKQATEILLPMWSEIGMDDVLELLGPGFKDPRVRAYAVRKLERADDEVSTSSMQPREAEPWQELMLYLLQLVQALKFDAQPPLTASGRREHSPSTSFTATDPQSPSASSTSSAESGLTEFLIRRAANNSILGNNLYWYLQVECDDRKYGKMFKRVRSSYLDRLSKVRHIYEDEQHNNSFLFPD